MWWRYLRGGSATRYVDVSMKTDSFGEMLSSMIFGRVLLFVLQLIFMR